MSTSKVSSSWKWWVCGLLLAASVINYMDRQTLANAAVRITREFQLSQEQYGNLELAFGWAFAAGSLVFGYLADRFPVRWLYPAVLALWSAVGFATGRVHSYESLLTCRTLLGFFEAGHWPCALKTTQRLLLPKDRTMGNSVLQSGTSIGAILTPILMANLMTDDIGSWRFSFQVIGAGGLIWIFFWLGAVRPNQWQTLQPITSDSPPGPVPSRPLDAREVSSAPAPLWRVIFSRRFLVLLIVISLINSSWQVLRAWLPKFLIEGRGYTESYALYFNSLYYVATDIGCLGAGALTLWWHRRGRSVHAARVWVFFTCGMLTALATAAAALPRGWPLLAVLLLVGAGALGLFPCYYALSQELTTVHQGMVTGLTGVAAWLVTGLAQKYFGRLIDQTHSFDLGLAIAGWLPLVAFVFLWWLWDDPRQKIQSTTTASPIEPG